MLSWAMTLFFFFSLLKPETDQVKIEPLSYRSLGEKGTRVCKGMCGGEGKGGKWATDDRSSPVPLEPPPNLGWSLSVSLETWFGLFRIHEGRDKITD